MRNADKVAVANKIVQYAKELGFTGAYLKFSLDEDDEFYESLEDVIADLSIEEEVTVTINIFLDDELTFELNAEEEVEYK